MKKIASQQKDLQKYDDVGIKNLLDLSDKEISIVNGGQTQKTGGCCNIPSIIATGGIAFLVSALITYAILHSIHA